MRLIDKDNYCENICRCNREKCDKGKCPIHTAPTAYDIDKVVEQLERLKQIEVERKDECDEDGYGDAEEQYDDGMSDGKFKAYVR